MKTKIIPFDLETAKKIQAGEIKGKIKTRDGEREMRIVCCESTAKFRDTIQPIIAQNIEDIGELFTYYENGSYLRLYEHEKDLVLEVPDYEPQEPQEPRFKPFDKVLVRRNENEDGDPDTWVISFFMNDSVAGYRVLNGEWFDQCIPYEGNENLLGTTDKPKELC